MTTTLGTSPLAPVDAQPAPLPRERATLVVTISDLDSGVLVRLEGEAGTLGLQRLQLVFARIIARRTRLAVLDLSHLTFLSSLAIGELMRLRRDLGRWNGLVRIASCPPLIRAVFELARLTDFFAFHASVEEALAAV